MTSCKAACGVVFVFCLISAVLLLSPCCSAKGHGLRQKPRIPEPIKFAAGIHNNYILGHFRRVMNWTTETLGKNEKKTLKHCAKSSGKGGPFCVEVPMPTPWTTELDLENPLPEYPRPQLQRTKWLSLNGIWSFKSRGIREIETGFESWDKVPNQQIVVPFPVESYLSGIVRHDVNSVNMQYKRHFTIPREWNGQRIILHFDAVDHTASVYVNGHKAGSHTGGYDRFSFDITDHLEDGENELIVHAFDPTEFAHIPIGKQRLHPPRHPSSIYYTSTSGIWQTVWLEPVPVAYIKRLELVPNIDDKTISIVVHGNPAAKDAPILAEVTANGNNVASGKGKVGQKLSIDIPDQKLWSPDSPFLYDLEISLEGDSPHTQEEIEALTLFLEKNTTSTRALQGLDSFMEMLFGGTSKPRAQGHQLKAPKSGGPRDSITSYFGMRKSSLGKTPDGGLRPMINNEFVFQTGMLDQGFWPDGLYTPASDAALIWDLEFTKEMGYNMLRKHTKVESDRWICHPCFIKLAPMTCHNLTKKITRMSSHTFLSNTTTSQVSWFGSFSMKPIISEVMSYGVVKRSFVGWGQHDTIEVVKYAQSLDSSRIFDGASGWVDHDVGDMVDMHNYVGPGSPNPTGTRAAVLGEFGGLGRRIEGHMWIPDDAFAYEMHTTAKELEDRLTGLYIACGNLMEDPRFHLSASVYTELSDVEAEINGWVTYDRQIRKVNTKVLKAANERLISRSKALNNPNSQPRIVPVYKKGIKSAKLG